MSDEQNPVVWMVRNGVVDYQLVKRKEQADHLVAELQKRHDLSGSLSYFNAVALYTHPNPAVVRGLVEACQKVAMLRGSKYESESKEEVQGLIDAFFACEKALAAAKEAGL